MAVHGWVSFAGVANALRFSLENWVRKSQSIYCTRGAIKEAIPGGQLLQSEVEDTAHPIHRFNLLNPRK